MKIERVTYYILFLFTLALSTYLLSISFQYFLSGATTVNKYDLGLGQLSNHNPKCTWLADDENIQGVINPFLRKDIKKSYLDAWGILNLSLRHKSNLGLEENFTDTKVDILSRQLSSRDTIIRDDLDHNLQLHFLSYDKQVVSFTDRAVILQTTIKAGPQTIRKIDTSDYKIVMTLNDGKWRVNKFVRTKRS